MISDSERIAAALEALVEQQRIANLIAYLRIVEGTRGANPSSDMGAANLDIDIQEGLGL